MNAFFKTIVVLTTLSLGACATLTSDIEVETQIAADTDFSSYRTYAWAGSAEVVFDPVGQWEQPTLDTDEEVRFVINRELRARDMIQVDTDPDLLVAFAAGVDTTALDWKDNPENEEPVLTSVPKAALVVAMVDAKTGYIIWLGYATGEAQEQLSIEKIRSRIDYAVSEIFKPL